jgi:hypothetical protein
VRQLSTCGKTDPSVRVGRAHRLGATLVRLDPLHEQAARCEPLGRRRGEVAREQAGDAGAIRGRGLREDHVVAVLRREQHLARVSDHDAHARVREYVLVHRRALARDLEHSALQLDDVDAVDPRHDAEPARGAAGAEPDHERRLRLLVQHCREQPADHLGRRIERGVPVEARIARAHVGSRKPAYEARMTVKAVYENGVLKPRSPLPLKEHEEVEIDVRRARVVEPDDDPTGWKAAEAFIGMWKDAPRRSSTSVSEDHDAVLYRRK